MQLDDKVCYCFKVSLRKLVNFARRERPQRVSQMSNCLDAGTGCGWCIPYLERIARDPDAFVLEELDPDAYAAARKEFHETGLRPEDEAAQADE
ncbi:MAG: (2Fe-2S)-binding protein [Planctomycetota bacterium]|nr:(2Fe-2S)-binding protein [Planctomycetota bacterium]